jgi:hypothetical protein
MMTYYQMQARKEALERAQLPKDVPELAEWLSDLLVPLSDDEFLRDLAVINRIIQDRVFRGRLLRKLEQ